MKGIISGKQLIGAIASEHNLNVFGGELAEHGGRQNRGVGEGFVEPRDHEGNLFDEIVGLKHPGNMLCSETFGHLGGVLRFVETRVAKPDGKCLEMRMPCPMQQRHDRGRVEPAREQYPDGHIRHQPFFHGRGQQFYQMLLGVR